jgi:glutaredoxin 3
MVRVEIYCTDACSYCGRAKRLLEAKGVSYTEWRVDQASELRTEMERRSGRTSVPQIFLDNRHVGGFDELSELDVEGELDRLLGIGSSAGYG